jgi:hypothetical protein
VTQVYGYTAFETSTVSVINAGAKIQGHVIDFAARRNFINRLQRELSTVDVTGSYEQYYRFVRV